MKKTYLLLLLSAFLFPACSDDNEIVKEEIISKVNITASLKYIEDGETKPNSGATLYLYEGLLENVEQWSYDKVTNSIKKEDGTTKSPKYTFTADLKGDINEVIDNNQFYFYVYTSDVVPLDSKIYSFQTCDIDIEINHIEPEIITIESLFENKNLVTFGNSITSASNSWAYIVYDNLKFGNLYNGAVGSSSWSKRRLSLNNVVYETQDYNDPNFAGISSGWQATTDPVEVQKRANNCAIVHIQKFINERSKGNTPSPDYIILSYGTNGEANLGDPSTTIGEGNLDLFSMADAIKWSINTLKTEYPKVKLYLSLPIQAANPTLNATNLQKIAVMKDICTGMSVTYFDSYNESGITEENQKQYLSDGLHPNEAGKRLQGDYITEKLKKVNGL